MLVPTLDNATRPAILTNALTLLIWRVDSCFKGEPKSFSLSAFARLMYYGYGTCQLLLAVGIISYGITCRYTAGNS